MKQRVKDAIKEKGLTGALSERDAPFGDYRTTTGS